VVAGVEAAAFGPRWAAAGDLAIASESGHGPWRLRWPAPAPAAAPVPAASAPARSRRPQHRLVPGVLGQGLRLALKGASQRLT
jgi:hypothetical protein